MWDVFEQPWTLLIAAGVSLLLVLILRAFVFEKPRRRLLIIPAILVLLAFGLDLLVQTDPEQIRHIIDTAVEAVEDENSAALEEILADDYADSRHRSKQAIVSKAKSVLVPPLVDKIYGSILELHIIGQTAEAVLLNRILFDKQSAAAELTSILPVKVKIDLEKQSGNGWLIKQTEILSVNNQPTKWKDISYSGW